MDKAIPHHGPVAYGTWCKPDAGITLLHQRLSILGLPRYGRPQPRHSAKVRFMLTYDGETYNRHALRHELDVTGKWKPQKIIARQFSQPQLESSKMEFGNPIERWPGRRSKVRISGPLMGNSRVENGFRDPQSIVKLRELNRCRWFIEILQEGLETGIGQRSSIKPASGILT